MNKRLLSILTKITYAVNANIITLLISVLTTLMIPKFLGNKVEEYGYFQLYMFFVSYIGIFHFGWCDGILLHLGGKRYEEVNKKEYNTQLWLLLSLETIISITLTSLALSHVGFNINQKIIACFFAIDLFFSIGYTLINQILQATLRIKEYGKIIIINRIVYIILVLLIIFLQIQHFQAFIIAEIVAKITGFILATFYCKEIVYKFPKNIITGLSHARQHILSGSNLWFSNLVTGFSADITRIMIVNTWGIIIFGQISLTLKIVNFILIFVNSVSLVLYPTLRRYEKTILEERYNDFNSILMIILLGVLCFYYPLQVMIISWLPQYATGLRYMAMLCPVCIYACKSDMIILTYMKSLRLEKLIMRISAFSLIISCLTTFTAVYIIESLSLAIFMIVFNKGLTCIISEFILSKKIKIRIWNNIRIEFLLCTGFILCNWWIQGIKGFLAFIFLYTVYLLIKKNDIQRFYKLVRGS